MASKSEDIKQSDEWQKAVDYSITDEDIERQRKLLGFMQAAKTREGSAGAYRRTPSRRRAGALHRTRQQRRRQLPGSLGRSVGQRL